MEPPSIYACSNKGEKNLEMCVCRCVKMTHLFYSVAMVALKHNTRLRAKMS